MHIRQYRHNDLPILIDLTIEAFRPLFENDLPKLLGPPVFDHDHSRWAAGYDDEVAKLHEPELDRFVTVCEQDNKILGYVGWNVTDKTSGRLELVAVAKSAQQQGVGSALCRAALRDMKSRGVRVVHVGTGGDAFHAPARRLYESLGFHGLPTVDYTQALTT